MPMPIFDRVFMKVDHTNYTTEEAIEKFSDFEWVEMSDYLRDKADEARVRTFNLLNNGLYLVGGAVRDAMLGLGVSDRDYVVTNQTPESMLAMGFTQVGANFPVFIHPTTKEEYALARTEEKVAAGYHGFTTKTENVSITDDLARRDITINSIARNVLTGEYIDPTGGIEDLRNGVIRCVNKKAFIEDPLRILRILRFATRYKERGFKIEPETSEEIKTAIKSGVLNEISYERYVVEIGKVYNDVKCSQDKVNDFWALVLEYELEKHSDFFSDVGGELFVASALFVNNYLPDRVERSYVNMISLTIAYLVSYIQAAYPEVSIDLKVIRRFFGDTGLKIGKPLFDMVDMLVKLSQCSENDIENGKNPLGITSSSSDADAVRRTVDFYVSVFERHQLFHDDNFWVANAMGDVVTISVRGDTVRLGGIGIAKAIQRIKHVNADMFPGKEGRELGEAIHNMRVQILVDDLLTEYLENDNLLSLWVEGVRGE